MPEASGSDVADESDYSIFENKSGLAEDMKFLASMPELCDVTFLVGNTKEPICAVKAVLAARSRVFQKLFDQAPSPQRKKEPMKENKFRTFLKRSSEPLLNLQNVAQQPNQHHTLIIDEFEPDVFRQLIEYIHTGCVTLQPRTLLGLMNAADLYGLEQLRKACTGFVQCCITVDTVCALLASAERYIQYKGTKSLVQKVLEFVNEHGNEVLSLGSFTLLPEHVVRLILAREELQADEFTKFQAALMWSKKYWDSRDDQNQSLELKDVIGNFLQFIQFHKIPTSVLMKEIYPLRLVPGEIIMTALAYQADPSSVDTGKLSPHRVKHQDRSLSVQSSLQDQFGSNTSLSSNVSVEGSDEKQHSGKHSVTAEQEMREQQQWNRKRGSEDEDLQRLIEQRTQFQTMRQEEELQRQNEELQTRKQEEELRKQEMQEEFDRRQKEQLRKKKKEEEEKRRKEEEEGSKVVQDDEEAKRQKQEEALMQQLQLEEERQKIEERQRREALDKLRQDELMEQRQRSLEKLRQEDETKAQQEDEVKARQDISANIEKQQDENLGEGLEKEQVKMPEEILQQQREEEQGERPTDRQEGNEQQTEEESLQPETKENKEQIQLEETTRGEELREKGETKMEQEESLIRREEEHRRLREERKLQLQLQELKVQWSLEQDALQMQEEMVQRQIEERRYDEEMESLQFPQVQLQLEGRKPMLERPEKRQKDRKKSRKRKRVEIREHEAESPKQETAPAEGVAGLYIKLVVRQEGRAPLVWLFKTHKF
ncbi:trichohyalin isoform X2 [Ceratina calcarata]|uniref:Trichohyalin isoform X2 n=1 Tax=Ceratina calcarata TaxID=156304 RepID=A0AAJ7J0B4_9HYME|nr:trichohyalin isoform X2 [Ceratina calcarata]